MPEIIVGRTVLNSDGTLRWTGTGGSGNQVNAGTLSLVADLDLDGQPEVVAGNTAYRADGSIFWSAPVPDGFNAVGNFDDDAYPEVVLVANGTVRLLEHNGQVRWGPKELPGNGGSPYNFGGPPTVADVDSDGQPEIGVAGAYKYTVFETDGTVKCSADTVDYSSFRTGSSVFDFEGDGSAEVIYSDQERLYIYRGSDGAVLWQTPSTSNTAFELPVIADVDADGHAEIVVPSNWLTLAGGFNGVQVYGDAEAP